MHNEMKKLEEAVVRDDVETLSQLSESNIADFRCKVMDLTAIQLAYTEESAAAVKLLIDMPRVVNSTNDKGENYIEYVLKHEGISGLIKLEELGVDIAQTNAFGESVFHYSAKSDTYNCVLTAYKRKLDFTQKNTEGLTIIDIAALDGAIENLKTLLAIQPEHAKRLLNLSAINGSVRALLQSVADSEALKVQSDMSNTDCSLSLGQNSL